MHTVERNPETRISGFRAAGGARRWRDLAGDDGGAVALIVVFISVALFGVGALLLDLGRMFNLQTQEQSYADHVALAAAMELNGTAGSIDRAISAAVGGDAGGPLVTDTQSFATGDAALSVQCLTFLSELGEGWGRTAQAGDTVLCDTCGGDACSDDDDIEARFVEAVVQPRTVQFGLAPLMRGFGINAPLTGDVGAFAVAGFIRSVCRLPMMAFCNPYEDPDEGGGDFNPVIGQQILMKTSGSGAQWVPGEFGLLDFSQVPFGNDCTGGGAALIRCILALEDPNVQCLDATVDVEPGEKQAINKGFNVRFDIWDELKADPTSADFWPGPNVTKGKVHGEGECTENSLSDPPPAPNNTVPLPRDPCFATNSCASGGGANNPRFGDGVTTAQLQTYWATNHPAVAFPADPTPGDLFTRFDLYRYEIDNNQIPNKSGQTAPYYNKTSDPENGNPTCATGVNSNPPETDRRVMYVAVVNCVEQGLNGSESDVPVLTFAKLFLTEPVQIGGSGNKFQIWGEMLGVVESGDESGIVHEYPVLYR
jgi:hypothetical protein